MNSSLGRNWSTRLFPPPHLPPSLLFRLALSLPWHSRAHQHLPCPPLLTNSSPRNYADKLSKFFGESSDALPVSWGGAKPTEGGEAEVSPFHYVGRVLEAATFATNHAAENSIVSRNHTFTSCTTRPPLSSFSPALIFATDLPSTQCAFGVAAILWEVAGIKNDIDMTLAAILYTYHLHR